MMYANDKTSSYFQQKIVTEKCIDRIENASIKFMNSNDDIS